MAFPSSSAPPGATRLLLAVACAVLVYLCGSLFESNDGYGGGEVHLVDGRGGRALSRDPRTRKVKRRRANEGPSPSFRVQEVNVRNNGNSPLSPSELAIEVLDPAHGSQYSITVVSRDRYTGAAALMSTSKGLHAFTWRPPFAGEFEVLVHELDAALSHATPLIGPPLQVVVTEAEGSVPGLAASILEDRVTNAPPCQTVNDVALYSAWDGDWLGPDFHLEESAVRTGWSFVPSPSMGCKLETFDSDLIRAIPEKKSIYILGRSVERGVFLSLVDLMLQKHEKMELKKSAIGKCWGRASVTKGNLEVVYQDFRVRSFEDPNKPRYIECHNDKLVKQPGSSFIHNATEVWREIFEREEVEWPSVVFLVTGLYGEKFLFEHHVKAFVDKLPPNWDGTLFLGDYEFTARVNRGVVLPEEDEGYRNDIKELVRSLNDRRVRWLDGRGVSKEMRMYGEKGPEYVGRSQHFHNLDSPCLETGNDEDDNDEAMVVFSNVTEMVGQLLLGHALGPKSELVERIGRNPVPADGTVRWCHACPKDLLPFHITPYPEMTCVDGPVTVRTAEDIYDGSDEGGDGNDPLVCPEDCLGTPAVSQFDTESDTVHVRQCTV